MLAVGSCCPLKKYMGGEGEERTVAWGLTPEGSYFSAQGVGWGVCPCRAAGDLLSLCGTETWPLRAVNSMATRGRCGHAAAHLPSRSAAAAAAPL